MATRKRPRLTEPSSEITIVLFTRQKRWVAWLAGRRRSFSAAIVRDAVDVYRAVVLAFDRTPLPDIKQLSLIVRAALTDYLARQQRVDMPSATEAPPAQDAPPAAPAATGTREEVID